MLGCGGLISGWRASIPSFSPWLFQSIRCKSSLYRLQKTPTGSTIKTFKPITPGLRHQRRVVYDYLWKGGPHRPLTVAKRGTGGRNHTGQITTRHRGGGHKRRIREIDFTRAAPGKQLVERIEYDPGRTAHIALLTHQQTGVKSYILAATGLRAGDIVESFMAGIPQDILDTMGGVVDQGVLASKTVATGNCLPLTRIPVGTIVHAIGMTPNGPAKLARSAGTYGQVMQSTYDDFAVVRLSSGEVRRVSIHAPACIGTVSNADHRLEKLGKAGRRRWLGWRPQVRGVAMNACDHPHGGGRGKSKGNKHPRSIWGWKTKGKKTRTKTSQFVVKPRPRGKEKLRR